MNHNRNLTFKHKVTLYIIFVGMGIPGLISFVFSLNSLQNCMIFTPLYGKKINMAELAFASFII